MSKVIVRNTKHLEELVDKYLPAHYSAAERRQFCAGFLFLLRHPEINPLRELAKHAQ